MGLSNTNFGIEKLTTQESIASNLVSETTSFPDQLPTVETRKNENFLTATILPPSKGELIRPPEKVQLSIKGKGLIELHPFDVEVDCEPEDKVEGIIGGVVIDINKKSRLALLFQQSKAGDPAEPFLTSKDDENIQIYPEIRLVKMDPDDKKIKLISTQRSGKPKILQNQNPSDGGLGVRVGEYYDLVHITNQKGEFIEIDRGFIDAIGRDNN